MIRRAHATRDMLFGLLALQNGMVDRDRLVSAFAIWTGSDKPLAELLTERGALTPGRRALLEALAAEHLAAHGDEPERSLAAIDVHRSIRESLEQVGGSDILSKMGFVGKNSTTEFDPDADSDAEQTGPFVHAEDSKGQRYRILRPHARGGLGEVFVALDGELNREVALKEILGRQANDPVSRQRFLIEAEITGGLEHPGIVPVYGLGAYDDGRPYYAMRFIRGDSLKEAIERFHAQTSPPGDPGLRSLELRKLLRRFVDVCNAVEYAHSRGVLHRDIKPSNVILGRHGETILVDWGLAKTRESVEPGCDAGDASAVLSPRSGSADTLPGSALGTPAYMPPEQAEGDLERMGPRSDVYSLGATLYCLTTGRAPFEGNVVEVLRKVQAGDFPGPRTLNPTIDRALEAVCLKAMAKEPNDRYASCRALADDIERWAADEAVLAYREPWRARLARWERRNKPLVYGASGTLAVAVVLLSVATVVISRARDQTEQARKQVEESLEKAEASFQLAVNANDSMISQFSDANLNAIPGMQKVRRNLADLAVRQFEDFRRVRPDDAGLARRSLRVYYNAALPHLIVGEFQAASMQYAAAVRVSEHYGLREHASYDDQSALAVAYRHYATFNAEVGRDKLADENFAKAARLYPPLREAYKHDKFVSEKYNKPEGWLMARWGEHQYQVGDRDGARKSAARAVELLSPIMNKPKEWNWYRGLAGIAHKTLAQVALVEGDVAGWDREMAEALKLAREVVREEPGIADTQTELATLLRVRGEGLAGLEGRAAEVDATLDEAVRLIDEINTKYTEKDGYRQVKVRAEILLARGRWLARSNRLEKAEADLVEAHRLARHLAEDLEKEIYPPTSQTFPGLLGRAEAALGRLEVRQGKAEEGRALLLKAGSHLGEACKKRPKSVEDRRELDELMRDPR